MGTARRVVIGLGNPFRRDDGVGPRVVAELSRDAGLAGAELRVADGDPARLLDLWAGAGLAVVVDALRSPDDRPGSWLELVLTAATDLPDTAAAGTHTIGVGSTVALGRLLGRMPERLVVLAVRGTEFGFGTELSAPVEAAVAPLVERVRALAAEG